MTYQEIKDRLEKCEYSLRAIQDGTFKATKGVDIKETKKKLQVLQESLQKQLKEAEQGTVSTDDPGEAEKLAKKGINVDLTTEQDGINFSKEETATIAKEVGKGVAKALKSLGD